MGTAKIKLGVLKWENRIWNLEIYTYLFNYKFLIPHTECLFLENGIRI